MRGSESRDEGRPITVLVYEYVTGGGLAGQDLPASWAAEGGAMRRAIARDFAGVPGVQVIMPVDVRLPIEDHLGVTTPAATPFESLAAEVDYTLVIAPETEDILRKLSIRVQQVGGRLLGCGPAAIGLTADKLRLGFELESLGIPVPSTRLIRPPRTRLSGSRFRGREWNGPVVLKPRDGAGSVDTIIVRDRQWPDWSSSIREAIAQPYLPGRPMSACFIVDNSDGATLLGVGTQRIKIDEERRISYRGGTIISDVQVAPIPVEAAVARLMKHERFPGLRGFVGVDYIDHPEAGVTVLEINPRPTTSYVGLAKLLGPGMIAGAWLDAMNGPLDATGWPDRFRSLRHGPDVTFNADGTIGSEV